MRRIQRSEWLALTLVALLLPTAALAGRLDGAFTTRQENALDGTNEACTIASGPSFAAVGEVTGTTGGCTVVIEYGALEPHKLSATALKGTKTSGTLKVSQSVFSSLFVEVFDTDGAGEGVCDAEFEASVEEEVEKCKVQGAIKGTSVEGDADTTQSGRAKASCELGENGGNLDTSPEEGIQAPSQAQFDALVAAFADRKDVKVDAKGKLRIKHKGEPDTETPSCPI
jgi:hypothetical protein